MATLKPFRALRYDPAIVGDLAAVVAPPYDVIDDAAREALYARSDFNVVRLTLNRASGDERYRAAAAALAEWRERRILVRDERPALYLYATRFHDAAGAERERFGVIGALRLEKFETGRVRPHETTFEDAKKDRFALLRSCGTSLEPIFGLVGTPGWRLAELATASPAIEVSDDTGARHRLWRLEDRATLDAVAARLSGADVLIADGHHRYETALRYRDEMRKELRLDAVADGSEPFDYVLANLTPLDDAGLVVLPTHRLLGDHSVPAAFRDALARHFRLEELPWTEAGLAGLLMQLDNRGDGAPSAEIRLGVAVRDSGALWLLRASSADLPFASDLPPELRRLDVSALHRIVLGDILGLPITERGGTPGLTYAQDAVGALKKVAAGASPAAFFLPATDLGALHAVSVAGLTMPEKSTFFHPKLLTGLVMYPLDRLQGRDA